MENIDEDQLRAFSRRESEDERTGGRSVDTDQHDSTETINDGRAGPLVTEKPDLFRQVECC